MKYLFIAILFLSSCKDLNKTKKETKKEVSNIEKRKDITLKNETFHLKLDGRNFPEKKVEVYGAYVTNRFNENKKNVFLDGISDYIEIKNHENINPNKEITISIWYKPDSFKGVGNNSIVCKGFSEYKTPYAQYLFSATGNLYPIKPAVFKFGLSINNKLNQIKTKPNIWKPNIWYNITGTYDGNKMILYVNGALQNQRAVTGSLDTYNTPLLIGKTPFKELFTSGSYDDFRIFNRALTALEINQIYQEH
jgi:hypothetical protein